MSLSKVLYFPTIRVPRSEWFVRALLYWDQVGTIAPLDYIERPELLDNFTRRLVQEQLVTQIIPAQYVHIIPRYANAFLDHLDAEPPEALEERRQTFDRAGSGFRIHLEKLHELSEPLRALGLARPDREPWHIVEATTASELMTYLAACLGRIPEVNSTPITDDASHLHNFVQKSSRETTPQLLDLIRPVVLRSLFPAPIELPAPVELSHFKERRGDQLRRFRRRVEQELTVVADMNNPELRQRRVDLFLEEAHEEIQAIKDAMSSHGWIRTSVAKVSAVLAAIPGGSPFFGLLNAVCGAFRGTDMDLGRSPFLYAAEAQWAGVARDD